MRTNPEPVGTILRPTDLAGVRDAVLDLCCCPGAKLRLAADAAGPDGSAHGVDVSLGDTAGMRVVHASPT